MSKIFNVNIIEEYTDKNGEVKKFWHKVGTAFPHKDGEGMNIEIIDGLSVSGKLVITERKAKDEPAGEPEE